MPLTRYPYYCIHCHHGYVALVDGRCPMCGGLMLGRAPQALRDAVRAKQRSASGWQPMDRDRQAWGQRSRKRKRKTKATASPLKGSAKWLRRVELLAERDGWTCHLCGEPITQRTFNGPQAPSLDHVMPKSQGGSNALANLKLAHSLCNHRRGAAPL